MKNILDAHAVGDSAVAVILARSTSSRLPGKHLRHLGERSLLEILVERLRRSRHIDKLIAAIPDGLAHHSLEAQFKSLGVAVWKGPEEDVAGRFASAARAVGAIWALRINGDCPFQDPHLIDQGIALARQEKPDFVTNIPGRTWPYGVSLELVNLKAYEKFRSRFSLPEHAEHVTSWLYQNPTIVRTLTIQFNGESRLCEAHLVVDTELDLEILSNSVRMVAEDPVEISTERIARLWISAKSLLEEAPKC